MADNLFCICGKPSAGRPYCDSCYLSGAADRNEGRMEERSAIVEWLREWAKDPVLAHCLDAAGILNDAATDIERAVHRSSDSPSTVAEVMRKP